MLQLLQPLWLWATAGILVPIAIHLWKIKRGKVLQVGSIQFLNVSTEKSSHKVQLNQLLLLLLRCVIIIIAAFFLTSPYWIISNRRLSEKGWILIYPADSNYAYEQYRTRIDSLVNEGYIFKRWDTSLVTIPKVEAIEYNKSSARLKLMPWNMIRQLNEKSIDDVNVFMFVPAQQSLYYGERPATHVSINFQFYSPADTLAKYIQHAHFVNNDSIAVVIAESDQNKIKVKQVISHLNEPDTSKLKFSRQNNTLYVALPDMSPTKVDENDVRITIVSTSGQDVSAIEAAASAIEQYTGYDVQVTITTPGRLPTDSQEWIFWLTEESPPANIKADNFFQYAGTNSQSVQSIIQLQEGVYYRDNFLLFRRNEYLAQKEADDVVLWRDGYGDPLLIKKTDTTNRYVFFSRFNPEWNNLAWDPVFPSLIFDLLFRSRYIAFPKTSDRRNMDTSQIYPVKKMEHSRRSAYQNSIPLDLVCWWVLLLLFMMERLISTRSKTPGS